MTKFIFANVSVEAARAVAQATVKAVVKFEGAKLTLLESVVSALKPLNVDGGMTAKQYDRQLKPYLNAGFEAAVKAKRISAESAKQYDSKLKAVALALVNDLATPQAGETFFAFYGRANPLVANASTKSGTPIWGAGAKRGRKAGSGKAKASPEAQDTSAADTGAAGQAVSPQEAAAKILCKGHASRAANLLKILESHAEQFDKFAASLLGDEFSKPEAAKPETAMAAALASAKRTQRPRKLDAAHA